MGCQLDLAGLELFIGLVFCFLNVLDGVGI